MTYNELEKYFFNILIYKKAFDARITNLIGVSLYGGNEVIVYYTKNNKLSYTTCLVGHDVSYILNQNEYLMFTEFEPYIIYNKIQNTIKYEVLFKLDDYHLVYDDGELIVYSLIPNIWKRDYTDDNIKIIEDL